MSTKKATHQSLFGLYVHWPYCIHKCPYCDFASSVCKAPDEPSLLKTYMRDMDLFPSNTPLTSLFFGGGTPSLMSPSFFERLMDEIQKHYTFVPDIEISMEVNPDTVDKHKLKTFHELGINRLSIGVQSLNDKDLRFLGRTHTAKQAIQCIEDAKEIFNNINIDLIYARPKQSLKAWEKELNLALSFKLPHYSLYQLTIEGNTVFGRKGQTPATDTQARRLYIQTDAQMRSANRPAYEVSNYAQKGYECRHNLTYWLGKDYIGIGPAAHGRLGFMATQNAKTPTLWIKNPPQTEILTPTQRELEKLLMGLRLRTIPYSTKNLNPDGIKTAIKKGWITQAKNRIYPTLDGTLMLNQLILMLSP